MFRKILCIVRNVTEGDGRYWSATERYGNEKKNLVATNM